MKNLIAILLAGVTVFAKAHQGETEAPQTAYDCEHPPADAVEEIPGILGVAGGMSCLPAGPAIHADPTWIWRYTGSFFDVPTIPGYAHVDSASMLPPFYFTGLSLRELSAEEAAQRSEQLAREVETYRPAGPIARMQTIDAVNNYGRSIAIHVAMESENNGWVLVCTPNCQPNYVILIEKRKRN
ncbi:MAG: hypothetical protein AMJ66_09830 [Betaproteobacteria bacterium SG8_40]|nr:MAG: hypothetical protein AMJ66_09830 [Betaproteobacteria bacterium SG8_40]